MNIYERSESLAAELASMGRPEYADAIRDAIAAGATGTEILMRLRGELKAILSDLEVDSREKARSILDELEKLLR